MEGDALAESLNDLFLNLSTMVKSELQGVNNQLELVEKMNQRVAEECGVRRRGVEAGSVRVVEQLKSKSGGFYEYVRQIEAIEEQVTHFESENQKLKTEKPNRIEPKFRFGRFF
ncbi:hypothetical protein EUGRSUZ_K01979 [Eucalyptus grandis]|uniref:Uncharacterized protein n=2 Tax=Eucalyptus grandis TaxID=71139 RepID=A0ACC3IU95_EUCGR|nr:hypothetical protein EUGRSUZ_K01979 [Eucalyptus grandis]